MPTLDKARSNTRVEQALSVSLGWVAHALCTSAAVLDVPLRYPVVFRGSQSVVLDPSKGERREQQEFPLYAKGVDVARADYAIFLLNKDLAQVRWQCGLVTADLKCMLRNLHEVLSLGDRQQQQQQQLQGKISLRSSGPSSRLLSPPPGAEDLSASSAPAPAQKRPQKAPKQQEPAAKDEVKSKNKVSKEPLQEGSSNGGNSSSSNSTWREIDSRTKALSIPTSFQRKKAVGAAAAGGGAGDSKQSTSAARPR